MGILIWGGFEGDLTMVLLHAIGGMITTMGTHSIGIRRQLSISTVSGCCIFLAVISRHTGHPQ